MLCSLSRIIGWSRIQKSVKRKLSEWQQLRLCHIQVHKDQNYSRLRESYLYRLSWKIIGDDLGDGTTGNSPHKREDWILGKLSLSRMSHSISLELNWACFLTGPQVCSTVQMHMRAMAFPFSIGPGPGEQITGWAYKLPLPQEFPQMLYRSASGVRRSLEHEGEVEKEEQMSNSPTRGRSCIGTVAVVTSRRQLLICCAKLCKEKYHWTKSII